MDARIIAAQEILRKDHRLLAAVKRDSGQHEKREALLHSQLLRDGVCRHHSFDRLRHAPRFDAIHIRQEIMDVGLLKIPFLQARAARGGNKNALQNNWNAIREAQDADPIDRIADLQSQDIPPRRLLATTWPNSSSWLVVERLRLCMASTWFASSPASYVIFGLAT